MAFNDAVRAINAYLTGKGKTIDIKFSAGFYMRLKKRIIRGAQFLEIHTSGYDGTLPINDALEWIKWTLLDYRANNIC